MTAALAVSDTALVAVLALPHALYACIWLRPAFCRALCGAADAVDVFCAVATALKGMGAARMHAEPGSPSPQCCSSPRSTRGPSETPR